MKKFRQTVSEDALTIHIDSNKRNPEPTHLIVKFPGGHVEIARCSDGAYWVHLTGNDSKTVIDSRVEYNHEGYGKHGIKQIPDQADIKKLAVKFSGPIDGHEYF